MKNWQKWLVGVLASIFIFVVQITFVESFDSVFVSFNLILAVLAILTLLTEFRRVAIFVILTGVLLDIYSNLPFGVFLITLFAVALILQLLYLNFFTNRSFYALILLGLITVVLYKTIFLALSGFVFVIGISPFFSISGFWIDLAFQILGMVIILAVAYVAINKLSKNFKPIFLRS